MTYWNNPINGVLEKELIKKIILNYIPASEKEKMDQNSFLSFLDTFDDILTRDNIIGHLTASGFVVNEDFDKTLLVNHNIFGGYIYPGGHVDGEADFLKVAIREISEETGITVIPYRENPINITVNPTPAHTKKGSYISAHLHYDLIYLLIAKNEDMAKVRKLDSENSNVKWCNLEDSFNKEVVEFVREVNKNTVSRVRTLKR